MAIEGGYEARNPGQQWRTKFDGHGFVTQPDQGGWQWGLELSGYGFAEREQKLKGEPEVKAEGQRVTYKWKQGISEWYVNDERGLEHGYTIEQRPAGSEAAKSLEFELKVRGNLRPEVADEGVTVRFMDGTTNVVNYAGLKVQDANGKNLPARFVVAGNDLRLQVDERGARYPITIDPIAQQAYLKASNTNASDRFGWSVAVSGSTVVVGAYSESSNATGIGGNQSDNSANQAGAVYVFVHSGATWTQQAYLKASNTNTSDLFGYSVAISGNTVVVGAEGEASNATGIGGNQGDNSASQSGAAYVFVRSGTTWTQQAYLKASNTNAQDLFGISVGISGETIVVGAYNESSNATGVNGNQNDNSAGDSGAAYVFARSGTAWTQQAYLKASNTNASDQFGLSVSISGDTVVVGAYNEASNATGINGNQNDNSANSAGAAYVFVRSGTTWTQQAYLKASILVRLMNLVIRWRSRGTRWWWERLTRAAMPPGLTGTKMIIA